MNLTFWRRVLSLFVLMIGLDLLMRFYAPSSQVWSNTMFAKGLVFSLLGLVWQLGISGRKGWFPLSLGFFFASFWLFEVLVSWGALRFLNEYPSLFHLNFILEQPSYVVDSFQTVFSISGLIVFVLLMAIVIPLYLSRESPSFRGARYVLGGVFCIWTILLVHLVKHSQRYVLIPGANGPVTLARWAVEEVKTKLGYGEHATARLHRSTRDKPKRKGVAKAKTVLLVINESWSLNGRTFSDSFPKTFPWIGQGNEAHYFPYAYTNATATDVSMPSILTGVSPKSSSFRFHKMPLISNLASASGYLTMYASAQRLDWVHMDEFLADGEWTWWGGAKEIGGPIVNDMGIDDITVVDAILEKTRGVPSDKPVFIVFNTNALHVPFLDASEHVDIPDELTTRYERAVWILDHALAKLISGLDSQGRSWDTTFAILTSDHGEILEPKHRPSRIANFYEETLRIPIVMKTPLGWDKEDEMLKRHYHVPIQNIDLVPTLADAMGLCFQTSADSLSDESFCKDYEGQSLLRSPIKDRVLLALSTNDLRSWDPEGFALIQDRERLVVSSLESPRLFRLDKDPAQQKGVQYSIGSHPSFDQVIKGSKHLSRIWKRSKSIE